ncbi:MAG: hypothetical protein KAI39_01360, partial [Desulfobulbaceae bacterium]|nr:hypothetical protein [Desulfobulbaceae bacterium]
FSSYRKGLRLYFGEEEIYAAKAIIAGKVTFPGLTFAASWQELSPSHCSLLKLYRQLDETKQRSII